jgi:hypothetical protein
LLAGRFLVPRAALLALPDGPVAGLDLASGDLVGLAFGPALDDAGALAARIDRWNALGLPGCPVVRELCWHLGRPLVAFDLLAPGTGSTRFDGVSGHVVARCAALGEVLASAELGLPPGPADLELGRGGPFLRRPAIWPHDPGRPLSAVLADDASRLIGRVPLRDVAPATADHRRAIGALVRRGPGSRRARLVLLVACGLLSAVLVSVIARPTHAIPVARAAPPRAAPAARAAAAHPGPRRTEVPAPRPHAVSRGGPARVLLAAARPVARPAPPRVQAPPSTPPPVVAAPSPGWVDGLFVGS